MKILIADDHPLFAEGLKNLIETQEFDIIGIVNNGEKAVKTAIDQRPDVIFMDIDMPIVNGIEATRQIKAELPEVRVVILTSFEEEDSLLKAIKAGASGYLLKSLDGEELIRSLHDIKKGKNPFSAGLEDCLLCKMQQSLNLDNNGPAENSSIDDKNTDIDGNKGNEIVDEGKNLKKLKQSMHKSENEVSKNNDNELLTERQIEVIRLLVKGLTYREIGEKLFLSERTIKYHMEQIKERLNLKTQAQVISYAKKSRIITKKSTIE